VEAYRIDRFGSVDGIVLRSNTSPTGLVPISTGADRPMTNQAVNRPQEFLRPWRFKDTTNLRFGRGRSARTSLIIVEATFRHNTRLGKMGAKSETVTRPLFREITLEDFKATCSVIAANYPAPGDRNQVIANTIIKHYLGGDWLDTYVHSKSKRARYLRVDINAPLPEKAVTMTGYWEFAETLLNLQNVDGFETVLDEFAYGKIESGCGEIDIARMILLHELKFRFVKPNRGAKLNYDFEIFYPDGFKVCAETKSKFESTTPRAGSITESLKGARDQLPDDEPGVILVKVPERWIRDTQLAAQIGAVAIDYLRQSTHIMSIKFYSPVTVVTSEFTVRRHAYKEVSNPKFPDRDWQMFRDEVRPIDGMPRWWVRFYPELRMPTLKPPHQR
jgi:hypothetical protein